MIEMIKELKLGSVKYSYYKWTDGRIVRFTQKSDKGITIKSTVEENVKALQDNYTAKKTMLKSFINEHKTGKAIVTILHTTSYGKSLYETHIIDNLYAVAKKYSVKISRFDFAECDPEKCMDLYETLFNCKTNREILRKNMILSY